MEETHGHMGLYLLTFQDKFRPKTALPEYSQSALSDVTKS